MRGRRGGTKSRHAASGGKHWRARQLLARSLAKWLRAPKNLCVWFCGAVAAGAGGSGKVNRTAHKNLSPIPIAPFIAELIVNLCIYGCGERSRAVGPSCERSRRNGEGLCNGVGAHPMLPLRGDLVEFSRQTRTVNFTRFRLRPFVAASAASPPQASAWPRRIR